MQAPSTAPSVPALTVTDYVPFNEASARTEKTFGFRSSLLASSATGALPDRSAEHPEGDADLKLAWKALREHERDWYFKMKARKQASKPGVSVVAEAILATIAQCATEIYVALKLQQHLREVIPQADQEAHPELFELEVLQVAVEFADARQKQTEREKRKAIAEAMEAEAEARKRQWMRYLNANESIFQAP